MRWRFDSRWKPEKAGEINVPWIQGISCSPSGRYLVAISSNQKIYLVDWQTLKSSHLVDLSQIGHYNVACDDDKCVYYWALPKNMRGGAPGSVPVMRRYASGLTQPCGFFNDVISNTQGVFGVHFRFGSSIIYVDMTDIKHGAGSLQTYFHETERNTWLSPQLYYIESFISSDDGQWCALLMNRQSKAMMSNLSLGELSVWQKGMSAPRYSLAQHESIFSSLLGIYSRKAVRGH